MAQAFYQPFFSNALFPIRVWHMLASRVCKILIPNGSPQTDSLLIQFCSWSEYSLSLTLDTRVERVVLEAPIKKPA